MTDPEARPDPEELLRRVRAEEAKAKRGKLKIFFGFAPGVGKTYRMLQVARDLVIEQHRDVVIGIVEDHRRIETARMVLGLELLPRRKLEYRGRQLEELDVDAALARRPSLILVDELAHTNAPGSRHAKRWQDVEQLLEAGIDVATTLNVQHVESLNDVIAQITGVQVRETVPDSVLDRADEIELVDIAPQELLQRLREGKVYLPDQAARAADHFFQRGNLLALRELALRRTAQHVDEDVREYREEHGVDATWPAGERILVCVGPAPSSARLIRAAARMAAGLRCPWAASYVEATGAPSLSRRDHESLDAHLRLAESLGASVVRLVGDTVAKTILTHARKHNITRLIVGKPTHSRLLDRVRGSLLDELVRGSGDIDVHVISGDSAPSEPPREVGAPSERAPAAHYAVAAALVALTLGVALALRAALDVPDPEMLFILTVMATAAWFGRGPSVFGAVLAVACYDFFFVPPYWTFSVDDRRYILTFAMMFGVGFAVSELAGRLRRQERVAVERGERTSSLYVLTRELASTDRPAELAQLAVRHAGEVFSASVWLLGPTPEDELALLASSPSDLPFAAKDLGVARWCHQHQAAAGLGTDTLPGAVVLCAPLRVGQDRLGVLALSPADHQPLRTEQRAFLEVFCRQVAAALERARLAEEAKQAALRARTEEMRSSLLSAVSHDLRTPLASITAAAGMLRDEGTLPPATRGELVEAISQEAERLERLVGNLLDMTRLEAGEVRLKRDWVPLEELLGSALTRTEARLGARPITVEVAPEVPLLLVDPVLLEQVFVNLFDNAGKHTPPQTAIEVRAHVEEGRVLVEVADRGPGLAPGEESRVFEKFARGAGAAAGGAGLGLAICKGIAEAHGGSISAHQRPGGGAAFRLTLPLPDQPPPVVAS